MILRKMLYSFLGPGQQPSTVAISGFDVNTNMMFTAYSSVSKFLPEFTIKNDDVALETVETYAIMLVSANPSQNVAFGSDSTITITDEDGNSQCNFIYILSRINSQTLLKKKTFIMQN